MNLGKMEWLCGFLAFHEGTAFVSFDEITVSHMKWMNNLKSAWILSSYLNRNWLKIEFLPRFN